MCRSSVRHSIQQKKEHTQSQNGGVCMKQGLSGLKVVFFAVAMALAVSATLSSLGAAPSGQPSSPTAVPVTYVNPLQVALLHWYPANKTMSFPVGAEPQGVAFDGTDIWGANFDRSTVP